MSLSSKAHIAIGDYEYVLDHSKPEPYQHRFESLFSQTTAIAGEIAKQQLRPEKMLWYMTDFSGGEGFRIYYPQAPTRYDKSLSMNVTERGLLTTRAKRYRSSIARNGSTNTTQMRPAGGSAWNKAIILWGENVIYAKDARSWTAAAGDSSADGASYFDTDTDGRYLVPGIISEVTASRLQSVDGSLGTPTVADIDSGTTLTAPNVSEILEGQVYRWGNNNGTLKLNKGAGAGVANAFTTVIYNSGVVLSGVPWSDYWLDLEAAESGLYMSFGTPSGSVVFESRQDIGRPFWTSPPGFTIKKLIYHAGVLFCVGSQNASGKRFAALWAIPLSTRSPIFIAAPRRHRNEELYEWTVGCPGYGSTVMIGDENSGKIFIYDIENDAISLFDDLGNAGTGDGTSFTPYANLLTAAQSTFEAGNTLALNGWAQSVATATVTNTTPHYGIFHAQLSTGTAGSMTTPTGISGVPVTAATQYTLSAYIRASAAVGTVTLALHWWDSSGTTISTSTDSAYTVTTSYAQRTFTTTSPSGAAYVSVEATASNSASNKWLDTVALQAGSSGTATDKLAFLAMHGSRLFGATYQPEGVATSLQVISWDDTLKENRDAAQAIAATLETSEWDFGVPQEQKALNGVYVNYEITDDATTSGLVEDSRITISYALDAGIFTDTYTALDTIDSDSIVSAKGRAYIQVSDDDDTIKFNRIKFKITLDNNAQNDVAPPILYSAVAEAQLLAYSEVWDLVLRLQDEVNNEKPADRQWKAYQLYDNLEALATNKNYVAMLDGARYQGDHNRSTSHIVQVEDPQFVIENPDTGEGYVKVRLRSVPS